MADVSSRFSLSLVSSVYLGSGHGIPEADIDLNGLRTNTYVTIRMEYALTLDPSPVTRIALSLSADPPSRVPCVHRRNHVTLPATKANHFHELPPSPPHPLNSPSLPSTDSPSSPRLSTVISPCQVTSHPSSVSETLGSHPNYQDNVAHNASTVESRSIPHRRTRRLSPFQMAKALLQHSLLT